MDYMLIVISLVLWGYKSNLFKRSLTNASTMSLTALYAFTQRGLMFLLGLMFINQNVLTAFMQPYFYVLMLIGFVSSIGAGFLYNKSNATFTTALVSAAAMITSLLYANVSAWAVVPVIICIYCLYTYFKQLGQQVTWSGVGFSLLLIFVPTVGYYYYIPLVTEDYGNAMSVYGLSMLIPFICMSAIQLKKFKWGTDTRTVIASASISVIGHALVFYAFQITENKAILLFMLAYEALVTEISARLTKDSSKLNLGDRSSSQFISIIVFCLCSAVVGKFL
ncbi:hypothetical protein ABEW34_21695 [Paenibacillus algorifonticola]|uniref:hypothetical protein n=1 Tax=Paenibacillus algorifonticola TaxID=684063 RepID=UPI003D27B113